MTKDTQQKTLFRKRCTNTNCVYNVSRVCKNVNITDVCRSYKKQLLRVYNELKEIDMKKSKKAKKLVEVFGKLAPKVVDEIIKGLEEMYIYDNTEAYETRIEEVKWWEKVKKKTHKINAEFQE